MPISADGWAADTSVAVAALDSNHSVHQLCRSALVERRPAIAGHAAFETFSMLTRMPGQLAVDPSTAADVVDELFPERCWLEPDQVRDLLRRCGEIGVSGGAIYDALVGEAARVHGRVLLTRDQRARRTYDLVGVDYELVGL